MGAFLWGKGPALHPVNQDVQAQPHHVHKVPVPSRTFKTKVTVLGEVALLQAQGDEQQHQHAHEHVETVEAGQHVEG